MATSTVELDALARPRVGKGAARQVRREGRVPAVIYGDNKPPEAIALDYNEIWKQYLKGHFTSTVFKLKIDGEERLVIPRDMQLDPVRDTPVHIDFLRIGKDGLIRVLIPVRFINEAQSPGLKRGGVLNIVRHDVEVWCPYDKIPAAFIIDLAGVPIGRSIHVSSINMPEGVVPTITDRDFTVATVVGRGKQQAEEDTEATTTAEAAAPAAAAAEKKS
ncbi:50S ribosomal protein L25 [Candidatus Filomicrobium marinum]|uniref:Large ribosomal subunit protein bL25 n=1 Tax=Candidatus Filomicrobium marinum TaxID=1608628 RepID=A0A0D6JG73_9HYPH|nr:MULTISPECIES: 50S ribosomal protein L25/general stress protein Ctc [Filomicrobium]MCV0369865.1 50S ribosomal protein L25/general stress protein Ctc [Filomicrobium sp.]CFX52331.1 50S ribosomal protein L25 [Candidatus Filomicrobium marinum]CPR20036.1 50S ribosomal protein L25 [Candidatus Filomicrobium marinum]